MVHPSGAAQGAAQKEHGFGESRFPRIDVGEDADRLFLVHVPYSLVLLPSEARDKKGLRQRHSLRRITGSDTPEKEIEVFNKRVQAEDDQFSEFEEHLANQDFNYPNCNMYIEFSNTYKKKDLEEFAIELEMSRRFDRNIRPIIEALMEADVMNHTENNEPIFITQDGHQVVLSIDLMVEYLEQNDDMLGDLVHRWLQLRDVDIQSLLAASAVPSDEEDIIE